MGYIFSRVCTSLAIIVFCLICGAIGYGYTMNVIKLIKLPGNEYKQTVIRVLGVVVPPVGVIIGYFDD